MSTALTPMESKVLSFEQQFNEVNAYKLNFKKEANFALQLLKDNSFLRDTAQKNPDALQAAITNIAAIGISLNPAIKEAYLVPRGGKVCLDISYTGLVKLATDAGSIEWVQAEIVKEKDHFEYQGVGKAPIHRMHPFTDRGPMIGVYCVAKLSTGEFLSTVMSLKEVTDIRDKSSSAAKSGPWVSFFEEMSKKTVIKRASKLWPKSERVQQAVEVLNEHEGLDFGKSQPHVDQDAFSVEPPTEKDFADIRKALELNNRTEEKLLSYINTQFKTELTSVEQMNSAQVEYSFRVLKGRPVEASA